jgi:hypothetical protein
MDQQAYNRMIQVLQQWYESAGVPLYRRGATVYPFHVIPAHKQPLDSLLSTDPPATRHQDFAFYDAGHLQTLRARGQRLYNGVTFAFAQLDRAPLRLHAQIGRYFDHVATCMALENELLAGPPFPLREQLHQQVAPSAIATTGAGRSASLGVSVLTVFGDGDGYRALLAQRSAQTAHMPGRYHVLPAFMFQPSAAETATRDWSLRDHILREYAEELFNVTEAEHGGDSTPHPAYRQLQAMLTTGEAALYLTGITVNLQTTHISVCVLLLVHRTEWYQRLREQPAMMWETQHVITPPVATDADLLAAVPANFHRLLAPNGAAALWLGVDTVRAILQEDENT